MLVSLRTFLRCDTSTETQHHFDWVLRVAHGSRSNFSLSSLQLCGMLVGILVGGTDYFHLAALHLVMFASVLFWILTMCLFVVYLTGVHNRMTHAAALLTQKGHIAAALYLLTAVINALTINWAVRGRHSYNCWAASASLCFNCSAAALYLLTAVINALTVNWDVRGRHSYNCWAASASLCFNSSAAALYLLTAVINALTVNWAVRGRHSYNCWAASAVSTPPSARNHYETNA
ncbi:plasmolipin-like [Nothobranchius furzeri]|uniref:plasmolipin-like n=1 Tax=Nothobranchius furzeri TaxID=105023 RepID=UPI003904AD96